MQGAVCKSLVNKMKKVQVQVQCSWLSKNRKYANIFPTECKSAKISQKCVKI